MKEKTRLLFLLMILIKINSFSTTKINFKTFSKKYSDPTEAFIAVSKTINNLKGNVDLFIPKGIYQIGKQTFHKDGICYAPQNIIELSNCSNVKILGEKGAVLKYQGGLKFGAFNSNDGSVSTLKNATTNSNMKAEIGHAIILKNCTNIMVSNIEINGNNGKILLGGQWGDTGYQCWHNGISIFNTYGVTISKMNIHHMGLDGIYISNEYSNDNNIFINDSKFEYNARQGFSWISGNGIEVNNCSFSYTGKGGFSSSPGAGIDFEPNSNNEKCINGNFNNCKLILNSGVGIINDNLGSGNINFKNSYILNLNDWSIWVRSPNFNFKNCTIYGSIVYGCNANNWQESTKYINCNFRDTLINNTTTKGEFLAEISGVKRVYFENCNFYSKYKKLCWLSSDGAKIIDEKSKMIGCNFYLYNNNIPEKDYVGIIRSFTFQNNTFYDKRSEDNRKLNFLIFERTNNLGNNKKITTTRDKLVYYTGNATFEDFAPGNSEKN
jgi:hypothetical protein